MPKHDSMRWVPIGREAKDQLTFSPYLIVYLFKLLRLFVPSVTIEQVAIFYPIICFLASLLILYALLSRLLDNLCALLSVSVLAVFPPLLSRTMAGFPDRDALCLLLTFLSYYFYVRSCQAVILRDKFIFVILSGIVMAVLGLSWQGVGLLAAVIVGFNFIKQLLFKYDKFDYYLYCGWLLPILLMLIPFKAVYHDLSQPFVFLILVLPGLFLLLALVYLLIALSENISKTITFGYRFPIGIPTTLIVVLLGLLALAITSFLPFPSLPRNLLALWDNFILPLGSSRLSLSIQELQSPTVIEWRAWYGYFFLVFSAGVLLLMKQFASKMKLNTWLSLTLAEILIAGTIFTRFFPDAFFNQYGISANLIYISSIFLFIVGIGAMCLISYWNKASLRELDEKTQNTLFLLIWFVIMMFCARGGVRYNLFFIPIAVALGSYALVELFRRITSNRFPEELILYIFLSLVCWEAYALKHNILTLLFDTTLAPPLWLNLSITLAITVFLMVLAFRKVLKSGARYAWLRLTAQICLFTMLAFIAGFVWLGSYAKNSYAAALQAKPIIGKELRQAMEWMKDNIPRDAVVAAWWDYGSWINLLGDKATIIDEEQIPYWAYLMARHVMMGQSDLEVLEFLKTHNATHLLISARDISLLSQISALGSDAKFDRHTVIIPFLSPRRAIYTQTGKTYWRFRANKSPVIIPEILYLSGKEYPRGSWYIDSIDLDIKKTDKNESIEIVDATVNVGFGRQNVKVQPRELYFRGAFQRQKDNAMPCTLIVHAPTNDISKWKVLYLSETARSALMVRLHVLNQHSDFFISVYPSVELKERNDKNSAIDYSVRIWRINYPEEFVGNPKYLETEFPNPKLYRSWVEGRN